MMNFQETFAVQTPCSPKEGAVVRRGDLRITVLTPCLFRVEHGFFTDSATQTVVCRDFPTPVYEVREHDGVIIIATTRSILCMRADDGAMLWIKTKDCGKVADLSGNLKGTYRTLDRANGAVKLGDGILSKNGAAVLDDSATLLLHADGTLSPREGGTDLYYFTYGRDYRGALRDFYRLAGQTPLLPRYCLGNWWSRYWAYTQEEYLALIERFRIKKIPLTVATVDMDWHWVRVRKKFGREASVLHIKREEGENHRLGTSGWTGYSWNTDLFPDYRSFLRQLHEKELKVTLNLHPAGGVNFYEDQYEAMAARMGIDPATRRHVPFDITDPNFICAYFELLHHGYEEDGVDFWWIDWQQGKKTKIPGLDPLWALNHYHYLDSCRNGKRGLILSRYAGPGSHRYPLGFSGDTVISRASLTYQPYFTATASNIGYSWWSHDIGGHMTGVHDDEIYARWVQLGVFSPINRLHSTSDPFMGKEPWNYHTAARQTAENWLRFRKRLIPYLYTANYRTHTQGRPLIEPMYYEDPWDEDAYRVGHEYLFGSELVVAPIAAKTDRLTGLAACDVYLDGNSYTDLFTGDVYRYKGILKMYRPLEYMPVLAKAGAIVPLDMDDTGNGAKNPDELELLIFNGTNTYELYEDDGETRQNENGAYALRRFTVSETDSGIVFTIEPTTGDASVTVQNRHFRLSFRNIRRDSGFTVDGADGAAVCDEVEYLCIDLPDISPHDKVTVCVPSPLPYRPATKREKLISLISSCQGKNIAKSIRYALLVYRSAPEKFLRLLPAYLRGPAEEIFHTV